MEKIDILLQAAELLKQRDDVFKSDKKRISSVENDIFSNQVQQQQHANINRSLANTSHYDIYDHFCENNAAIATPVCDQDKTLSHDNTNKGIGIYKLGSVATKLNSAYPAIEISPTSTTNSTNRNVKHSSSIEGTAQKCSTLTSGARIYRKQHVFNNATGKDISHSEISSNNNRYKIIKQKQETSSVGRGDSEKMKGGKTNSVQQTIRLQKSQPYVCSVRNRIWFTPPPDAKSSKQNLLSLTRQEEANSRQASSLLASASVVKTPGNHQPFSQTYSVLPSEVDRIRRSGNSPRRNSAVSIEDKNFHTAKNSTEIMHMLGQKSQEYSLELERLQANHEQLLRKGDELVSAFNTIQNMPNTTVSSTRSSCVSPLTVDTNSGIFTKCTVGDTLNLPIKKRMSQHFAGLNEPLKKYSKVDTEETQRNVGVDLDEHDSTFDMAKSESFEFSRSQLVQKLINTVPTCTSSPSEPHGLRCLLSTPLISQGVSQKSPSGHVLNVRTSLPVTSAASFLRRVVSASPALNSSLNALASPTCKLSPAPQIVLVPILQLTDKDHSS